MSADDTRGVRQRSFILSLISTFSGTFFFFYTYIFMINSYGESGMYELTKNEELILLSIWKLEGNAYGVTIRENFRRITGKILNYGSLYNTLYLLVRRGFVESRESEPLSKKGGRRKIMYSLTPDGRRALEESRKIQRKAWGEVPDFAFEGKK